MILTISRHSAVVPDAALTGADHLSGILQEEGELWFRWSESGLELTARLTDSEIVEGCDRDEVLHFRHGDVLELFLKPDDASYYWEMYATPLGCKSTLFFRAPRNEPQPDPLTAHDFRGLRVESQIGEGGWRTRMTVPAAQLTALGAEWGPGSKWSLLVGRYNHGSAFATPELSVFPPIPKIDFHRSEHWARVEFRS